MKFSFLFIELKEVAAHVEPKKSVKMIPHHFIIALTRVRFLIGTGNTLLMRKESRWTFLYYLDITTRASSFSFSYPLVPACTIIILLFHGPTSDLQFLSLLSQLLFTRSLLPLLDYSIPILTSARATLASPQESNFRKHVQFFSI